MYSSKVMEHFMNPRNIGEIPDADGAGTVGNPVCVVPDTLIYANSEIKHVQDTRPGEKVLGHDGEYHNVKRVHTRSYEGKVYVITTHNLGRTVLTPDHNILALKMSRVLRKYRAYKKFTPDWFTAEELEKGDVILYPIPRTAIDVESTGVEAERLKWDFKSKQLPEQVKVDQSFLRLIGYFLAEGYTRTDRSKGTVGFVFGAKEPYPEDVVALMKAVFGLDLSARRQVRNSVSIEFYTAHLARFFASLLGQGAGNKHLPHWMITLPIDKQRAILCGLWRGDGYINAEGAKFVTISPQLAHQVKTLLLRQGIIFSFLTNPKKEVHKQSYSIYVKNDESLKKLANIIGTDITLPKKKKNPHKSWFDEKFYYTPIRRIEPHPYSGPVHNLEVEGSHSYVSNSLALHNCGDMMTVYIKVDGDRLQDVKFKTFGCGAAIATSSMVTELAKGKTIEEALEITKADVATSLGGLPPVKMHCSVLAVDGLGEAIYEYLTKRGLPIPDSLAKRHEMLKTELANIEKRYKEFFKMEEELLKEETHKS